MALSLLTQHPSFSDLQAFFDPTPSQQQDFLTKFDFTSNCMELSQMEYSNQHQNQSQNQNQNQSQQQNNQHLHQQNFQLQQQQQQQQQQPQLHQQYQNHISICSSNNSNDSNKSENCNNNNHNNNNNSGICMNNNNNANNNNNININTQHPTIIGNINQTLIQQNRSYMSGYHYQHTGADYEQVINFVDSPPNSEESWTDESSKPSPGPQIIDVQTIYSNSGSRKRRMDWDSLDIGQSENNTTTQTSDPSNKITITEKDKQKREKLSGRGSWTDEIGFDLNAEFNSNSYLNNESFLSFSPALTVLKLEPQTEQLKGNKSPLNSHQQQQQQQQQQQDSPKSQQQTSSSVIGSLAIAKFDKTSTSPLPQGADSGIDQQKLQEESKNDLNTNVCRCGSPQSTQQGFKQNRQHTSGGIDKTHGNNENPITTTTPVTGHGTSIGAFNSADKCISRNVAVVQQLSAVDIGNKLENNAKNANSVIGTATQSLDDNKFQYILAAATSIATRSNEETLTYLNQGQSYEIKLKKIGDLTFYRDKILKSVIKICFHERRLQFMEREQMQQWQASRPGERIIEVDVPLSYGLCHVSQPLNPNYLNTVEVFWDPLKEVGVYIKVNCISTEFTPKKHGGEKGVPFRLQIETYIETTNSGLSSSSSPSTSSSSSSSSLSPLSSSIQQPQQSIRTTQSPITLASSTGTPGNSTTTASSSLIGNNGGSSASNNLNNNLNNNNTNNSNGKVAVHAAACQVKVFKLKGADRKHKQDREKIQKRPQSEQEKFQPSYECTIMNDIPLDQITSAGCFSPEYMKIWPNSPVHIPKYDGILPYTSTSPAANSSPIAINSVTSTNSPTLKLMDANMVSPQQVTPTDVEELTLNIVPESTPAQVIQWLTHHRLTAYLTMFAHFSGSDILRMSKDDLIQICGLADGIRMFNILRAKAISPRLTIYVSLDGSSFNAIYLVANTSKELMQKLFKLPGFYELIVNSSNGCIDNGGVSGSNGNSGGPFGNWSLHSKYSGSGSNIFNDVSKSFIYLSGPAGVHITVTDEVLNNEIKDGSLYGLEVQNGKVIMKTINKNDN